MPGKGKYRLRWKVVLAILAGVILFCSGCSWQPWVQSEKTSGKGTEPASSPAAVVETTALSPLSSSANMVAVELYFKDPRQNKLVREKRQIPRVVGIARATMEELFKGPAGGDLVSPFPPGTELLDINVRSDGLCIVDVSREMRGVGSGGIEAEKLAVYAVVNTLTQFPTVKKVKILVEGQQLKTLAGGVAISEPLMRENSLISR